MKQAALILLAIIVGGGLIYVVIAILPFLIAVACIVFINWMIAKFLVGGFSPWQASHRASGAQNAKRPSRT